MHVSRNLCTRTLNKIRSSNDAAAEASVLLTSDPEYAAPHNLLTCWSIAIGKWLRLHKKSHKLTATTTCSKSRPASAPPGPRPRGRGHSNDQSRVNAPHFRHAGTRYASPSCRRPGVHSARVAYCRAVRLRVVCESRCRAAKSSRLPSTPR